LVGRSVGFIVGLIDGGGLLSAVGGEKLHTFVASSHSQDSVSLHCFFFVNCPQIGPTEGEFVGLFVGLLFGRLVGLVVGLTDGGGLVLTVGEAKLHTFVASSQRQESLSLHCFLVVNCPQVCPTEGKCVGLFVGLLVGRLVGLVVGLTDGGGLGLTVGEAKLHTFVKPFHSQESCRLHCFFLVNCPQFGPTEGALIGLFVGLMVGLLLGLVVGLMDVVGLVSTVGEAKLHIFVALSHSQESFKLH
jgi:uncharacterized membrane protein